MIKIRKQFKYEAGHIVRKAWSDRCSHSFHGHSFLIEIFFTGNELDNAEMLVDFGIIKKVLNPFIDSFDHSAILWKDVEDEEIINFFKNKFDRVIIMPWNSSAEMQARMFLSYTVKALEWLKNNEMYKKYIPEGVNVSSVRIHETKTGWAEAFNDGQALLKIEYIDFSNKIKQDWPEGFIKIIYGDKK